MGRLTLRCVSTDCLSYNSGIALDIEQVVLDLKRQADFSTEAGQRLELGTSADDSVGGQLVVSAIKR